MADGGVGYFGSNYWATNYWAEAYWSEAGGVTGGHWSFYYWSDNYWASNYWASAGDIGAVEVTDDATLTLTEFVTQVVAGPTILATTETLDLNAFQTDSNWDINANVTTASMGLTSFNPLTGAYVVGDFTLQWLPDAAITLVYNQPASLATLDLTDFEPSTSTPDGVSVGSSFGGDLELTQFPTLVENRIFIEPLPASLDVIGLNPAAAGIGTQLTPPTVVMTLTGPTHLIEATPVPLVQVRNYVEMKIDIAGRPAVFGRGAYTLPDPTFPPDEIENAFSAPYPSQYEICDRTGFRQRRNGLREEWTGMMVRDKSWERRNIQDFVRGVGEEQEGSPRPEQEDRFAFEDYPGGVTADDL